MKNAFVAMSVILLSYNFAFAIDMNKCRNLLSSVLKQPAGYYLAVSDNGPVSRLNISSDPLPTLNLINGWKDQQPQGLGVVFFDWETMLKYAQLASFKASSQEGHPSTSINQKFYNNVISCEILADGAFSMNVEARVTNTDFSSWPFFRELHSSNQIIKISRVSGDTILLQGQVDYTEDGHSQHFANTIRATLKKVSKDKFFY